MNRFISILITSILLVSCSKTEFELAEEEAAKPLRWLYDADPNDDFNDAINSKDYRFIGMYGIALMTPSVNIDCLNREKDIKLIEGTSDALIGYEHNKLTAIAYVYAETYNSFMKLYLRKNGDFKCAS